MEVIFTIILLRITFVTKVKLVISLSVSYFLREKCHENNALSNLYEARREIYVPNKVRLNPVAKVI